MRILGRLILILLGIIVVAAVLFFTLAPGIVEKSRNGVFPHDPYPVSDAAAALHDSLVIGDWHADPLLWNRDLTKRGNRGHVDIPRLIEGNVAVQVFTAVTKSPKGQNVNANGADAGDNITLLAIGQLWPIRTWNSLFERAMYQADRLHHFSEKSIGDLRVIRTRDDLDALLALRATGDKVVGGILGIEGAHPLEGDIANLDRLVANGYRLIALQHFFDNQLGGSLHGFRKPGLTAFGREVVQAVVDKGLILDLAHSSPAVVRDVLAMTDIPLVISHTGVHGTCQTPRNLPDDMMRDIAATGGVIAIGYWRTVNCDDTIQGIARSIIAAIDLVGVDHVSLGSDFDGAVSVPLDTSELSAITHELLAQGLSETAIRKVMGENMIRVLRARLN